MSELTLVQVIEKVGPCRPHLGSAMEQLFVQIGKEGYDLLIAEMGPGLTKLLQSYLKLAFDYESRDDSVVLSNVHRDFLIAVEERGGCSSRVFRANALAAYRLALARNEEVTLDTFPTVAAAVIRYGVYLELKYGCSSRFTEQGVD